MGVYRLQLTQILSVFEKKEPKHIDNNKLHSLLLLLCVGHSNDILMNFICLLDLDSPPALYVI